MPDPYPNGPSRFVLTADWANYAALLEEGRWKFRTRIDADAFQPGAKGVVYLTEGSGPYGAVAAVVEAKSDAQEQASKLWPFTVAISLHARPGRPVEIKPLLRQLSFVPAGKSWGLAFRGRGVRKIPDADFDLLEAAIAGGDSNGGLGRAMD